MSRAVIIGNGPSALEKNLGQEIDSDYFDAVFRINRWAYDEDGTPFKQFPEQVGTRCDYWVVNDLHLTETKLALKYGDQYKGVLVVAPKFKWFGINHSVQDLKQSYPFLDIIPYQYEDAINSVVDFQPKWPTTGLVTIHFAVQHFHEIYIHGFDTYDSKYERMHYFEGVDAVYGKNKYRCRDRSDHTPSKDRSYIEHMMVNYNLKYL